MKIRFVLLFISLFFMTVVSCAGFGTVSRGYGYTKQQIWEAVTIIMNKNYGGVKRIEQDPPTAVSGLTVKDKKFGIDKSAYQVFAGLSGFTRPYTVDVEVRVYDDGVESSSYSKDKGKAGEIQDEIANYLYDKRFNSSLQDAYIPY